MSAAVSFAIFVVAFAFIAAEKVHKVKVVLVAAGAMAVLGLIPGDEVFFSRPPESTGTSSSCCSA